ncbi:retrovirus-related pol polyprotein from transposon TNT 1-94 [Tanacetum coccineum]
MIKPTLYDGNVISSQHAACHVIDDEETLILEEASRSKMLAKQNDPMSKEKKVNTTPINYVELNRLSKDFGKRFVPKQELSDEQAFWLQTSHPNTDQSALSPVQIEAPKELLNNAITPSSPIYDTLFKSDSPFSNNQNALEIPKYFENNDLKAQLQAKDTTLCKLKEHIKSMRENEKEEKVKHEMNKIETINIKLEHSVAKLLSKNKHLHKEIENLKKIYKDKFDSIKKTPALSKEQCDSTSMENADLKHQIQDKVFVITSLKNDLRKLKGKEIVKNVAQILIATIIALGMFKIDLDPLAPRLLRNREAHIDYLKDTQEQADILQGIMFHLLLLLSMIGCPDCSLVSGLQMLKTYDMEPLSVHELRSRDTNLYTISLDDILKTSPICLLLKASKTKSWLWHRQLSHLNFGTLNKLAKDGLTRGLTKLKFKKDHLCSACTLGKSKKSSHQPKAEDTNQEKLYLLHMDLCGLMRVESINGKKYILVIVDDYSRFTWVKFLRSKDEAPDTIIKCIKNIQVHLNTIVRNVRTDNGTKFVNQTLREFMKMLASCIKHLLLAILNKMALSKEETGLS